jgi:hypothetical protein
LPGLDGGRCRDRTAGHFVIQSAFICTVCRNRRLHEARESRADHQKGLDFQREESVSVLAGERRVWR